MFVLLNPSMYHNVPQLKNIIFSSRVIKFSKRIVLNANSVWKQWQMYTQAEEFVQAEVWIVWVVYFLVKCSSFTDNMSICSTWMSSFYDIVGVWCNCRRLWIWWWIWITLSGHRSVYSNITLIISCHVVIYYWNPDIPPWIYSYSLSFQINSNYLKLHANSVRLFHGPIIFGHSKHFSKMPPVVSFCIPNWLYGI